MSSNDVLDDVAVKFISLGERVLVVPSQDMPTESAVSALYRY